MHSEKPGQVCEHGCGSEFDTVPLNIHELRMKFHAKVPIEGAGVVHVTTQPMDCRFDHWASEVVLWRYSGHTVTERVRLTSCGGSAESAQKMHTYWCDLETLTLCVQGVRSALGIIRDYFDRKYEELFGRRVDVPEGGVAQ
jgi:hypothetical protein